jgi:4-diphosphocytidyl-2-C-methyl-D-erythritol kinase
MSRVRILAPAKLTWSLAIGDRRADGFHDLDAEMLTLDLADELIVDDEAEGLTVEAARWARLDQIGAPADNLIERALHLAGRRAGVELMKRIPIGGGLGGGSADAGAILRWAEVADPAAQASLGGDVPFCTQGGRARVRGLGEVVEPLADVEREVTLLLPPLFIDTAKVYAALDVLRGEGGGHHPRNDLTEPAELVEPGLRRWREALAAASGVEAILAGSGSTLFCEGSPSALGLEEGAFEVAGATGWLIGARTTPQAFGMPQPL